MTPAHRPQIGHRYMLHVTFAKSQVTIKAVCAPPPSPCPRPSVCRPPPPRPPLRRLLHDPTEAALGGGPLSGWTHPRPWPTAALQPASSPSRRPSPASGSKARCVRLSPHVRASLRRNPWGQFTRAPTFLLLFLIESRGWIAGAVVSNTQCWSWLVAGNT